MVEAATRSERRERRGEIMPIKIKDDPPYGYRPAVICEVCKREIKRAEDGTAAFIVAENCDFFEISFLHNIDCFSWFYV